MYKSVVLSASVALFLGVPYFSAAQSPTISCLEADRGYQLIKQDGSIDVVRLYSHAVKKFGDSSLNRQSSASLHQFGVTTGDPREWARLFVMVCKQESGCRIARTYPDGSLERFRSTPPTEMSFGPMQFNRGEYGLATWAMVNSPSCTLEAYIRVAQQGKLFAYFGSMQRPNETLQHANWFNTTVQPFTDALSLRFDPNAPDMRTYQAVAPYFVSPEYAMQHGLSGGYGNQYGNQYGSGIQPNMMQLLGGQGQNGMQASPYAPSQLGANSPLFNNGQPQPYTPPGTSPTNPGGSSVNASAQLLVQPMMATVGQSVLISWTSVGMRAAPYCDVVLDGNVAQGPFGSGRDGTKTWQATAGSHTFELVCQRPDASYFEMTKSVSVQ